MPEETDNEERAEETLSEARALYPGEKLYENSRRVLFLVFFSVFLLTAHQHFFTPLQRSKTKLIILLCLLPFLLIGGLCCAIGWWKMRLAGAFNSAEKDEDQGESGSGRRQGRRRERGDGLERLPWQRRDDS